MIKKLKYFLFLLLFGVFWFSFCNAKVQLIWLDSYPSQYDSNYNLTFLKGGWLITLYLWQSKWIIAFDNSSFFWWAPNWRPYFYDTDSVQWFFGEYWSCDEITWLDYTPTNCSSVPIEWDYIDLFKWFFNKVVAWDYAYYNFTPYYYNSSANGSSRWHFVDVCWSSSEIWKSLCFRRWYCYSSSAYWCSKNYWSLVGGQNYNNLTFSNIPYSSIGVSPWTVGYGWQYDWSSDWSSDSSINNQITGDYSYYDCTWKDIIIALESEWYNNYVCYWWLDNFNLYDSTINYNPIPWTWLSIGQIWGHSTSRAWDNFSEFFVFWNWLYKDDSNNYNAMRESYPAVYHTYFQLYNQYKWSTLDPRTLLEYCNIKSFDNSTLNNSAWWYFKSTCETVVREKQTWLWQARLDWSIYSWWVYTGDTPISVNWGWVWNMSWLVTQSDWLSFIQNYFNLIKSKLPTNFSEWTVISPATWLFGVIPNYIIVFLLAIILFKFLSK